MEQEQDAAEEYRVWKKNSPFLYDLVISHALEWPSLTVQWLPPPSPSSSSAAATSALTLATHRLLIGTHTSDSSPNHLMLAEAHFPHPPPLSAAAAASDPSPPPPSPLAIPSVSVSRKIPHRGEVNRARHMPQAPSVAATKTCSPEVHLFRDVAADEDADSGRGPDLVLRGHENEGYGLDWSPLKQGLLLSGAYDNRICLWDVGTAASSTFLDARDVFVAHEDAVEDVAWHVHNENLFGSVGDDHLLMIWDLRASDLTKPQHSVMAHEDEVNSLSFNPFNEWILATGSADSTVNLFDLRKLTTSLHTFSSHSGAVVQVEWSPDYETVLASSAADKRLMIWDLCKIGDEQTEEDAEDGPPELLFVHGGHTAKISEFSWNPSEPWVIASVAEDNILQIWQLAESIYRDDYSTQSDGDMYAAT
ncbi:putative WD-40 repeat-containing protein MSI3 isoform X2 [Iris pallida]|uniref:WD-40 repeat-containing protein MSI3 isoform X2 n=1 Tax=Iris pallida TaxID=29817 RepID=A0AAX6HCR2_IRIPA|nr:putative WD-40 repeat-containing protein MSI3 isoform X2 [Iris pallida]